MPLKDEFLNGGLYYVRLTTPNNQITKKVIVVDNHLKANFD